jgi:hypothetical protein
MTHEEQRIVELQETMRQIVDHFIKAVEILINQAVLHRADPNPLPWIEAYLEEMRATLNTLITDQPKAQRPPMQGTEMDELERLLLEAEQVRSASRNQGSGSDS